MDVMLKMSLGVLKILIPTRFDATKKEKQPKQEKKTRKTKILGCDLN